MHAALFGLLALTVQRRFGRGLRWVLLYAALSEVLQAVLPIGRDGNVPDLLADAIGAFLVWRWAVRHPVG